MLNVVAAVAIATAPLATSGQAGTPSSPRLSTVAWSLRGPWHGVATDGTSGTIYALGQNGKGIEVDPSGIIRRELVLPGADGSMLRLARFRLGGERFLLAFGVWRPQLRAYDSSGKEQWAYPGQGTDAIDDVWAADLDGDGLDETIVGYNGRAGVDVLKLLAAATKGGTVYVFDIAGRVVASVSDQGASPEIAWTQVKGEGSPLLPVASGLELNAYRLPR